MLTISLVIPVLNAGRTLVPCLNALGQLNPQPLEIILVDNGSTDGTLSLAKQFQARHANCLIL
ncbi:MAG: glycosyltransferase, partial [Nitrospiraceae bacterium]